MHIGPVEGKFTDELEDFDKLCPKCKNKMICLVWESSCGGYEDYRYECSNCAYGYWIEGPDA